RPHSAPAPEPRDDRRRRHLAVKNGGRSRSRAGVLNSQPGAADAAPGYPNPIQMRATRAYIASLGTTSLLVASSLLLLVVVSAIVAFNGWPGSGVADSVENMVVNDDPPFRVSGPAQVAIDAAPAATAVAAAPAPTAPAAGGAPGGAPGGGGGPVAGVRTPTGGGGGGPAPSTLIDPGPPVNMGNG